MESERLKSEGDAMSCRIAACVMCCLALVGCSQQEAQPVGTEEIASVAVWQMVAPTEMTETQKAQQELCLLAVNAMMAETLVELEAALESGDPSQGIAVCREKAPAIAAQISGQFGLKIGRTSFNLRNPSNLPPEWADELVAARSEKPAFLAGPGGEFGALLPIKLKAECQMCHGPAEMIDDEILIAIAEHYPQDEAVGFAEGDLRGWIWAEVPPGEES